MSEISSPQLSVRNIMDRLQETIKRHQENGNGAAASSLLSLDVSYPAPTFTLSERETTSFNEHTDFPVRPDDRYYIDELSQYADADFVRYAYQAVLHRTPDPSGFTHYLQGLRSGLHDKTDILASMRYSAEGRSHGVEIKGLKQAVFWRRAGRVPIIGYLLNIFIMLWRLPQLVRRQQQHEANTAMRDAQIAADTKQVENDLQNLVSDLSRHYKEVSEYERHLRLRLKQHNEELKRTLAEQHTQLNAQQHSLDQLDVRLERQALQFNETNSHQASLYDELQSHNKRMEEAQQQHATAIQDVRQQIKTHLTKMQQTRRELTIQERRLTLLLEEGRRSSAANETLSPIKQDISEHFHDAFYASFEDLFRGTREDIKNRLGVHLEVIKQAGVSGDVLDIGCGRGEWLELLKYNRIQARGVDLNRVFIEECRAHQLDVVEQDALAYLRTLPDNTLQALTSFHLIEHLPFETLVKMLDEILRVLKPGGLVILETPNPENLMVGSYYFYTDPTHRNPLPSQTMQFLLEARGFSRLKVLKLHPADESRIEGEEEIIRRFNDYFYGPLDYAIVGWKI